MIINGLEWNEKEIKKQINRIEKNLEDEKKRLKRWKKYLKQEIISPLIIREGGENNGRYQKTKI